MFQYRQWLILPIGVLCLLSGASIAYAQKEGDNKAQAIESVKKNLASDPKNQGPQAIGGVKDNLKRHSEDQDMHHALNDLQHHSVDPDHVDRDHAMPHGDAPHSADMRGSPHH